MCMVEMAIFNIQRAISRKTRVTVDVFCMSSHGVNICVKFHENMTSGFKVMEQTQKLLTDTHKKTVYPIACIFVCRGYNQSYHSCVLHVVSWFNICVKFHESMSSGFELMEPTQKFVNTQRAISPKVGKPELRFMCSAHRLMVFHICVKFHENMSNNFKLMEQTQKLFTHRGQ